MEGSDDARTWQPLREHANDASLAGKMAVAAWALDGATVGGRSFRHFRVRQTGQNAGGDDYLNCAGIELYGRLATRELSKEEEEEQEAAAASARRAEKEACGDDY